MKKRRWNALDTAVAVLIVAVIAVAGWYLTRGKSEVVVAKTTIEFDVLTFDLSENEAASFKAQEGEKVVFGKSNTDIGTIKAVSVEPYEKQGRDLTTGSYRLTTHPDRFQAVVTIQAQVTETEDVFRSEKEEIRIGERMPFLGKGIGFSDGYVIDLREVAQ